MPKSEPPLLSALVDDMTSILSFWDKPLTLRNGLWLALGCDGFIVLSMFRTRQWCRRRGIPGVNRLIRLMETGMFAIELGNDIELGRGVLFVHTVGVVVGGEAKVGDRCVFLGNNTIGAAENGGSPVIGERSTVGAGARIVGHVEIGEQCLIGANAVVTRSVPAGKVALGIPARVSGDNPHRSNDSQPV